MLYNYETINFDLGCGGLKCNFKFNKDFTIINNKDFEREINFLPYDKKKEYNKEKNRKKRQEKNRKKRQEKKKVSK